MNVKIITDSPKPHDWYIVFIPTFGFNINSNFAERIEYNFIITWLFWGLRIEIEITK